MPVVKWFLLILLLGGVVWVGFRLSRSKSQPVNPPAGQTHLTIGQTRLKVEIKDTDAERELGLSYREALEEDEGMLFVFPQPQRYAFWMKEMRFPLDMIWIREGVVKEVTVNVPAPPTSASQPVTVVPQEAVDQVLEVNAGWTERHGVKVGDNVSF